MFFRPPLRPPHPVDRRLPFFSLAPRFARAPPFALGFGRAPRNRESRATGSGSSRWRRRPAVRLRSQTRAPRRTGDFTDRTRPVGRERARRIVAALRRLRDQVRILTAAHGGKWSYDFTFVRNDGTSERLSGENRDTGAIPASTLKMIPAWVAFRDKLVTNRFLARMLKKSDNHMANGLTRLLGGPQRLEETLHADPELRVAGGSFRLVDGSGLSTANRVTAASEVLFLRSILASRDHYDVFKTLLARPGEFGTLRGRFAPLRARERLFAKTGTLPDAGVASLAGFLETERGVVVFSIIGNDLNETARGRRGRPRKVRRFRLGRQTIDRIVGLHAAYAG